MITLKIGHKEMENFLESFSIFAKDNPEKKFKYKTTIDFITKYYRPNLNRDDFILDEKIVLEWIDLYDTLYNLEKMPETEREYQKNLYNYLKASLTNQHKKLKF